ncbi:MAG: DUF4129 domain-containing protein [Pseudomonadota bacterium]
MSLRSDAARAVGAARALRAASLAALALYLAAASPAAAQTPGPRIEREIDRVVESRRYQTELPEESPPPEPTPPRDPVEPVDLGPLAQILLYGVLAAAAIFILATVFGGRISLARRGAVRANVVTAQDRAAASPSAAELADAEAEAQTAAAEGRFAEAIHILLLGAIGRLRERNARSAARSFTSREILGRAAFGEGGRAALEALVLAVEISRFGGRAADRAAYERCLEAYRALRRALSGPGPNRRPADQAGAAAAP